MSKKKGTKTETVKLAEKITCQNCGYEESIASNSCTQCGELIYSPHESEPELQDFDSNIEAESEEPAEIVDQPRGSHCVNCVYSIDHKGEEAKSECETCLSDDNYVSKKEQKQSEDKAHDDEFMDSIDEEKTEIAAKKPLTPAQAAARRKELESDIESKTRLFEKFTSIGEMRDHEGLNLLLTSVQAGCIKDIEKCDTKEAKNGIKDIDAVIIFTKLVQNHKQEAKNFEKELQFLKRELDSLGSEQLSLLSNPTEEIEQSELVQAEDGQVKVAA